mmetsp:Transcript_11004/g.44920  ORF Transcript_11004/g.44920 Transcript_11004/m.44920 type:complete len:223 (-) Transcript_11004:370-1038(-)
MSTPQAMNSRAVLPERAATCSGNVSPSLTAAAVTTASPSTFSRSKSAFTSLAGLGQKMPRASPGIRLLSVMEEMSSVTSSTSFTAPSAVSQRAAVTGNAVTPSRSASDGSRVWATVTGAAPEGETVSDHCFSTGVVFRFLSFPANLEGFFCFAGAVAAAGASLSTCRPLAASTTPCSGAHRLPIHFSTSSSSPVASSASPLGWKKLAPTSCRRRCSVRGLPW